MVSLLLRIWQAILVLTRKTQTDDEKILTALQKVQDQLLVLSAQAAQIIDFLVPGPAVGFTFTAISEDGTIQTGVTKMDLRDDQKVDLSIQPVDKKGKPALVDGVPAWASSDETVITLTVAADGLSASAAGVAPGAARVTVTADADLGAGVTDITGVLEFNVTGGAAATITINAGTPTDQ